MHDGRIRQLGTPEAIYAHPDDRFVAEVVGAANFFDVTVDERGFATDGSGATFYTAFAITGTGRARAMVRPDKLLIDHDPGGALGPNTLRGKIRQRLFMGGHYEYVVETGSGAPRVLSSREFVEGAQVVLSFQPGDCIILAGE
jgi:ABC-type Fe3+/spermidine/putrescine transport system ATPase subunit